MAEEVVVTSELLESKLREGISDIEYLEIVDESGGCGAKFLITIVSPSFQGKPLLQQHRLVHKVIEEERKSIHALTLKTKTPDQWAKEQNTEGEKS